MIFNLKDVDRSTPCVGVKARYLGQLTKFGFSVPTGFVIASNIFEDFLNNVKNENLTDDINETSSRIQNSIFNSKFSEQTNNEIIKNYNSMESISEIPRETARFLMAGSDKSNVIVRVSTEAEIPTVFGSFNIRGNRQLMFAIKKAIARLFSSYTLLYKKHMKLPDDILFKPSIIVQKFINAEKFGTISPFSGDWLVESSYQNENWFNTLVFGHDIPHQLIIDKYSKNIKSSVNSNILGKYEIDKIISSAERVGEYFNEKLLIEWCILRDRLYILGAKPLKQLKNSFDGYVKKHDEKEPAKRSVLLIKNGQANILPFLDRISGVVANKCSYSSRIAFLCRETGTPFIISNDAVLDENQFISVENGKISIGESFESMRDENIRVTKISSVVYSVNELEQVNSDEIIISEKDLIDKIPETFQKPVFYIARNEYFEIPEGLNQRRKICLLFEEINTEKIKTLKQNSTKTGIIIKTPYDMLRIEEFYPNADVIFFDIANIARLMTNAEHARIDNIILRQVYRTIRKCKNYGLRVYCSNFISKEIPLEDVVEKLILSGTDGLVVKSSMTQNFNNLVLRIEKKILLDLARKKYKPS